MPLRNKAANSGSSLPPCPPFFAVGKKVWIKSVECCGTIVSAADDGYDGDWWIASEGHGYQVVRYENEIELLTDEDSIPANDNSPSVGATETKP